MVILTTANEKTMQIITTHLSPIFPIYSHHFVPGLIEWILTYAAWQQMTGKEGKEERKWFLRQRWHTYIV